jgi:hypothetical protein
MALLKQIQAFFGVGILFVRKNGKVVYSVQSYNDLINVIIPRGRKILFSTPHVSATGGRNSTFTGCVVIK